MGERGVRNAEVVGSIPMPSTIRLARAALARGTHSLMAGPSNRDCGASRMAVLPIGPTASHSRTWEWRVLNASRGPSGITDIMLAVVDRPEHKFNVDMGEGVSRRHSITVDALDIAQQRNDNCAFTATADDRIVPI